MSGKMICHADLATILLRPGRRERRRETFWASSWSAASAASSRSGGSWRPRRTSAPRPCRALVARPDRANRGHVRPARTCLRLPDLRDAPLPERRDRPGDHASAVLLRALEPITEFASASGPGRLCRGPGDRPPPERPRPHQGELVVAEPDRPAPAIEIVARPRVGVDYAGEWAEQAASLLHRRQSVHLESLIAEPGGTPCGWD